MALLIILAECQMGLKIKPKVEDKHHLIPKCTSTSSSEKCTPKLRCWRVTSGSWRFTAKIKKFIKAHNRNLWLQDELKRSCAQLQKLGEQLDLDAAGLAIEDD